MGISKDIIVSNRLPISLKRVNGKIFSKPSSGGLATGLKSYHKNQNGLWIGWPGVSPKNEKEKTEIQSILAKENCHPVFVSERLVENYYDGFSNATIWPLFHYFSGYTIFRSTFWRAYLEVNRLFAKEVLKLANKDDVVWIHDYQLMLLPELLKAEMPSLKIGFFLHIPFPSFEIFRTLPWRKQLLKGILGSDLVGFHTYDYARHFLSSAKRLNDCEVENTNVFFEDRKISVEVFPMGIDYKKFNDNALSIKNKDFDDLSKERQDLDSIRKRNPSLKFVLSIDRLDYSKGILERLRAFSFLLSSMPVYLEKISLIMLVVPSRENVAEYQNLKSELEEAVASINGEFGSINWTPVIYFYRSIAFNSLVELYNATDVALLTPLRDGMNLVAKEFIACQTKKNGVLILSEMAGAAKELDEAIIVNPNNILEVTKAIHIALQMPEKEAIRRVEIMQNSLAKNNVFVWANAFMDNLKKITIPKDGLVISNQIELVKTDLFSDFKLNKKKVVFLDYDGTLVGFEDNPEDAFPDEELITLLEKLCAVENTSVVLISGRDKDFMDKWFGKLPLDIIAEHGLCYKYKQENWQKKAESSNEWKAKTREILEHYCKRTPASSIEEKSNTLVWHYRKSDLELGEIRAKELVLELESALESDGLEILIGKKVIEIKSKIYSKGFAVKDYLEANNFDFVICLGDDKTDESMFMIVNKIHKYSIKVGEGISIANYSTKNHTSTRILLNELIQSSYL